MSVLLKAAFLAVAALGASVAQPTIAHANDLNPTVFAGVSWVIGPQTFSKQRPTSASDSVGISVRILTTGEAGKVAGATGVTRYMDGSFGCDAGVALNHGRQSIILARDFCKKKTLASVGGLGN